MANSTTIMLEAMNKLTAAIEHGKSTMDLNSETFLDSQDALDVAELKPESAPTLSLSMGETLQNCLNPNKKSELIIK